MNLLNKFADSYFILALILTFGIGISCYASEPIPAEEPTSTNCFDLVSNTPDKLVKLIDIWLKTEGQNENDRKVFFDNLFAHSTSFNPFSDRVTSQSVQLEKAAELTLPLSDQEWQEFLTKVNALFELDHDERVATKFIDTETKKVVEFEVEATLPNNGRPFLGTPHWIRTPSGKLFVFIQRINSDQYNIDLEIYEYNPKSRNFHFLQNINALNRYRTSELSEFIPVSTTIEEDRILIYLNNSVKEKSLLFEVDLKTGKERVLFKSINYLKPDFLVVGSKIYFCSISFGFFSYFTSIEIREYFYQFNEIDIASGKSRKLHTERVSDGAMQLSTSFENGIIQWNKYHSPSQNVVAEFDTDSNQFNFWWSQDSENTSKPLNNKKKSVLGNFRSFFSKEKAPSFKEMGLNPPVTFKTQGGETYQATSNSSDDNLTLYRLDSAKIPHSVASLATDYNAIRFFESYNGKLYLALSKHATLTSYYLMEIYEFDTELQILDFIGSIDLKTYGSTQYQAIQDHAGRLYFVSRSSKDQLVITELDSDSNQLTVIQEYPLGEFELLDKSLSSNSILDEKQFPILGINPDGNLQVVRVTQ